MKKEEEDTIVTKKYTMHQDLGENLSRKREKKTGLYGAKKKCFKTNFRVGHCMFCEIGGKGFKFYFSSKVDT